jgi:hypothetical protein
MLDPAGGAAASLFAAAPQSAFLLKKPLVRAIASEIHGVYNLL